MGYENVKGCWGLRIEFWAIWEMIWGPLSIWREVGTKEWRMIPWRRRRSEALWVLLLVVGNASTHPEKVSTKTRRHLMHWTTDMWLKSSCQSVQGREATVLVNMTRRAVKTGVGVWRLQILQEAVTAIKKGKSARMGYWWALKKWDRAWILAWKSYIGRDRVCGVSGVIVRCEL